MLLLHLVKDILIAAQTSFIAKFVDSSLRLVQVVNCLARLAVESFELAVELLELKNYQLATYLVVCLVHLLGELVR